VGAKKREKNCARSDAEPGLSRPREVKDNRSGKGGRPSSRARAGGQGYTKDIPPSVLERGIRRKVSLSFHRKTNKEEDIFSDGQTKGRTAGLEESHQKVKSKPAERQRKE